MEYMEVHEYAFPEKTLFGITLRVMVSEKVREVR